MYTYNVESHTFVVNFQRGKSKRKKKLFANTEIKKESAIILFYVLWGVLSQYIHLYYLLYDVWKSHFCCKLSKKKKIKRKKQKAYGIQVKFPTPLNITKHYKKN